MTWVRASRDGPSDQDVHANGAPGAFNWDFDKDHGFYSECVPGCDMSTKELPETNNRLYEFSCQVNSYASNMNYLTTHPDTICVRDFGAPVLLTKSGVRQMHFIIIMPEPSSTNDIYNLIIFN